MSDRARSSVRTGAREGSGTADGVPEAAVPLDDASTGSSAADPRTPAAAPAESEPAPAARTSGTSGGGATGRGKDRPVEAAPAQAQAAQAQAAQALAAQAPTQSPGAQSAQPAGGAPAGAAPAQATPPAAHPITPLGPPNPGAGPSRQAPDGARPVNAGGPPVPPSTGTRPAAGRSGMPAAGSLPIDSTQAVQLPPGGARPVDPASRTSAARPAESSSRPAGEAAGRSGKSRAAGRGPRRARLQLRNIDTFSALKISLVTSIVLFFVWMIAVAILYGVLGGLGVFDSLNEVIGQLSTSTGAGDGDAPVITAGIVLGGAAVIGLVNVVLLTALCTVTAFIYNLLADMVGGLEVTLAERE